MSWLARTAEVAAPIANMFFVPLALFIEALEPDFLMASGASTAGLSWWAFVTPNLVPVTIGNVIGGALLVGGVYWFIYLRKRPRS